MDRAPGLVAARDADVRIGQDARDFLVEAGVALPLGP